MIGTLEFGEVVTCVGLCVTFDKVFCHARVLLQSILVVVDQRYLWDWKDEGLWEVQVFGTGDAIAGGVLEVLELG